MNQPNIHADEVPVDVDLVHALLRSQFPEWADLPLARVASTGTDNVIVRLGDHLGVRLPRIHWAVQQIEREQRCLPLLAPHVPVTVPTPIAAGEPGCGYPYPWLIYRWIDGGDALGRPVPDWSTLASEVASFVAALRKVHGNGAPPARGRVGSLVPHDLAVRAALAEIGGIIDAERALAVWDEALAARPWDGTPVWVHGDLLPGNLVLRDEHVVGVIDWSAAGVGDPTCDAMIAWSLPPDARQLYRDSLDIDDDTWARARGWTVQQAALFIPYYRDTIPDGVAAARRRMAAVLTD